MKTNKKLFLLGLALNAVGDFTFPPLEIEVDIFDFRKSH